MFNGAGTAWVQIQKVRNKSGGSPRPQATEKTGNPSGFYSV